MALATLGAVSDHNGRATFAANLLASGGIETVRSDALESAEPSAEPIVVICGNDAAYTQHGADVVATLRAAGAQQVMVAGAAAQLPAAVDGALVAGIDAVEVLAALLDRLGVA
jgi:methylmalonyl-CoA mutase